MRLRGDMITDMVILYISKITEPKQSTWGSSRHYVYEIQGLWLSLLGIAIGIAHWRPQRSGESPTMTHTETHAYRRES